MLFHIMMMSMKTAWKWESVNLSSMEKRKVSTFLANEEKKRLLKSGKDNVVAFHLKHRHVFLKGGHLFKKDGHLFYYMFMQ
jgi:hypothetical protein